MIGMLTATTSSTSRIWATMTMPMTSLVVRTTQEATIAAAMTATVIGRVKRRRPPSNAPSPSAAINPAQSGP